MNTERVYFVSGIDTSVGKSYATGFIARQWNSCGRRTITQKFIQTGNTTLSEDIVLHRKIMETGLLPQDLDGTTMPEIFTFPASPLLASRIDGRQIDFDKIHAAQQRLLRSFDALLVEGAGGLMVPLTDRLLTIDYIAGRNLPLILVTSGRLGSINHTLLSLEAIRSRGIKLDTLAYNLYPEGENDTIARDTRQYLTGYMTENFPDCNIIDIPQLKV